MVRYRSRLRTKTGIEMTPMVDVVFLLIIFFMTSSTFVKIRALKVDLPQAAAVQSEWQDQVTITLQVDGIIALNGVPVQTDELITQLRALTERTEHPLVIIEGDKQVAYQDIVTLMSLAKAAGVARVSLAARVP